MLHNKATFGSRNASEGRFCVLHTVLIGLNDKFNEKVITYVRIKVIKGIVRQHIMQKGTNNKSQLNYERFHLTHDDWYQRIYYLTLREMIEIGKKILCLC